MFEPLADSASTDECCQRLMLTNAVNGCLTCHGKSYCAEAEVANSCIRSVSSRCDCGY